MHESISNSGPTYTEADETMTNERIKQAEAERLVGDYSDLILRLSYTYLKSTHDAEDICQTVFMKLLKSEQSFDSTEHEKAWVIRATANACKDALRKVHRRRTVGLEAAESVAFPEKPEGLVFDEVMSLSRKYREAIYLFYYENYSIREIAALTGRSEDAVAAHLSRARKILRATLEGNYCGQGI